MSTSAPPPAQNRSTPAPRSPSPTPAPTSSTSAPASSTPAPTSPSPDPREPTPAPDGSLAPADAEPADNERGNTLDGIIEMDTFTQILDLDEDDTHEFSKGMAWAYFSQAADTFQEMDEAYASKDLAKLSSLGHFLKGSSAALGVCKVQASCEQVQHYGDLRDEELDCDLSPSEALTKIDVTLRRVRLEYAAAESWLKGYYEALPITSPAIETSS